MGLEPKTKIMYEATQAAKRLQQGQLLDELGRKTMNGTLGHVSGEKAGPISVQVGDTITHNHLKPSVPKGIGTVAKMALAAMLLGGGGAGALGLAQLLGAWQEPPPAMTVPVDKNTLYEFHLGDSQ